MNNTRYGKVLTPPKTSGGQRLPSRMVSDSPASIDQHEEAEYLVGQKRRTGIYDGHKNLHGWRGCRVVIDLRNRITRVCWVTKISAIMSMSTRITGMTKLTVEKWAACLRFHCWKFYFCVLASGQVYRAMYLEPWRGALTHILKL